MLLMRLIGLRHWQIKGGPVFGPPLYMYTTQSFDGVIPSIGNSSIMGIYYSCHFLSVWFTRVNVEVLTKFLRDWENSLICFKVMVNDASYRESNFERNSKATFLHLHICTCFFINLAFLFNTFQNLIPYSFLNTSLNYSYCIR